MHKAQTLRLRKKSAPQGEEKACEKLAFSSTIDGQMDSIKPPMVLHIKLNFTIFL